MLPELRDDNSLLMSYMRETRVICAKYNNVPRTSLIEARIVPFDDGGHVLSPRLSPP